MQIHGRESTFQKSLQSKETQSSKVTEGAQKDELQGVCSKQELELRLTPKSLGTLFFFYFS